jgi:RpiB/LacA/LacB family sugar-phosphate isomerase
MKIYIGADHRGFNLKGKIKSWLFEWNHEFEDLGAFMLDPKDDYTVFASLVAKKVAKEKDSFGILICGSGVGVDVVANKFDGIRAAVAKSVDQIKAGRHDDDMNTLVIAADFTKEKEAKDIVKVFLETKFGKEVRYEKRLEEIKEIELKN